MRMMLAVLSLLGTLTLSSLAQGTLNFTTKITGVVDAPVYDVDGTTPLAGSAYKAQLYAGKTAESLAAVGAAVPFRTGAAAGYIDTTSGATREVPTVAPGATAYCQMKAWDAAKGATFEAALAAGGKTGSSTTFTVVTGGGLNPPSALVGLKRFNLTQSSPPTITSQPTPVTTGLGGTAKFQVVAGGVGPFTYQWRKGNSAIGGATGATLTFNSVVAGDAGSYSVRVSNAFGYIDSTAVALTIAPLPTIGSVTISPNPPVFGKALHLAVTVTGTGPFTYQWQLNGSDLGGATSSSLDRTAAEAGTFSVKVSGPGGTAKRDVATVSAQWTLTVVAMAGGTVTVNPSQTSYADGTQVTLTAKADPGYAFSGWSGDLSSTESPATLTMNGHKSVMPLFRPTGGTVNFVNRITGTLDAPVFETDGTTKLDGNYVAQLWAGPTAATLAAVGLPIAFRTGAGVGYFPGEERAIATVSAGQTAYIQVRAWRSADGSTYEAARAAGGHVGESPTLAVVTGNAGSPPSFPATLLGLQSFRLHSGTPPTITQVVITPNPPVPGQPLHLGVTATGTGTLTYQWQLNGSDIPGATAATLDRAAAEPGVFAVKVTGTGGTTRQDIVTVATEWTLTLVATSGGSVTVSPARTSFTPGTVVTLTAKADAGYSFNGWSGDLSTTANPATLTMNGHKSVMPLFSPTGGTVNFVNRITGTLDAPVFESDGSTKLDANYVAQLWAGPNAEALAAVGPPIAFRTGTGVGYFPGEERSIPTVTAGDLAYAQVRAWRSADGSTYDAARTAGGHVGESPVFTVITGNAGSPPSFPATLVGLQSFRLRSGVAPAITQVVVSPNPPVSGQALHLAVTATGTAPLVYQWLLNDAPISGATQNAYDTPAAQPGTYAVRVTGPGGSLVQTLATVASEWSLALTQANGGSLVATPSQATYTPGTIVSIKATPAPGWEFGSWLFDLSGSANPASLTMNGHKTVSAEFRPVGGTVNFVNRITGTLDAPIYDIDGTTRLAGTGFLAQLYAGTTVDSLTPIGDPESFRTGAAAGYFFGDQRSISTIRGGQPAQLQVRAWRVSDGATFEIAAAANGHVGSSPVFTVITGNAGSPPSLPAVMAGLVSFHLRIGATPIITRQPVSLTVMAGATATFDVVASSSTPMSYQWRKGSDPIPGATLSSYSIPVTTPASAGRYSVRVTNPQGFIDSTEAVLTVLEPPTIVNILGPATPPTAGQALRLEAVATGTPPLVFQWLLNGAELGGDNAAVLDRSAAAPGTYAVRVTGPGGVATREALTVVELYALTLSPARGGVIVATPSAAAYTPGTRVSLRAEAEAGYEFTGWSGDASGTANPTTVVMNAPRQVSANFRATGGTVNFVNRITGVIDAPVFDADGTTKLAGPAYLVQLYAGPTATSLAPVGPALPFRTAAAAGYFAGEERSIASVLPGAVAFVQLRAWNASAGSSFEAAVQDGSIGLSDVISVITGNAGSPPSLPALLVGLNSFRIQPGSAPNITTPPVATVALVGQPAQLSVVATGHPAPRFIWRKNNSPIPGADAPTLAFTAASPNDSGSYSVVVSNALGIAESPAVALTVLEPPAITRVSGPETLLAGEHATLEVVATGSTPLRFEWYRGQPGQTSATPLGTQARLEIGPLFETMTFWVRVRNDAGFVDSTGLTLTVQRRPQTIEFAAPATVSFGTGPVTLVASASSGLPVTFTLLSGPGTLSGATLTPTAPGLFRIRASQPGNATYLAADDVERGLSVVNPLNLIGSVFVDLDNSGNRGPGETGLPSVRVLLLAPDNITQLQSTLTDAQGGFAFSAVPAGTYSLLEVNPPGYASTTPDLQVIVVADGSTTVVEFGDQPAGTISGLVFEDADGDGLPDENEPGLAGVQIRITGNGTTRTLSTAANGTFRFTEIPPGAYSVDETNPSGYSSTTPNHRTVNLVSGGSASANFGEQLTGTVSGIVYDDLDGNGLQESHEPGLSGVTVRLTGNGVNRVVTTTATGTYQFQTVAAGVYSVEETDPAGFGSTTPNVRSVLVASGGSATTSFGDQAAGSVGGSVFADLNGNGLRDPGESGIAGVDIRLSGNSESRTVVTDSDGSYQFLAVTPGLYTVEETDPEGFASTTPNLKAVGFRSGGSAAANFGDQPVQTISGLVFEDTNGNGRPDPGEPGIAGVALGLLRATDESLAGETTTSGTGLYAFVNVPAGSYLVRQSVPSAYTVLTTIAPPHGASLQGAPVTPTFVMKAVTLDEDTAATASFGINAVATLSGLVFDDLDGDGAPSTGEPGLGGVTIEIRGATTGSLVATTTTSGNGIYSANSLPPGTYTVSQLAVSGYRTAAPQVQRVLASGGAAIANFANRATATLTGRVFNDENGDGLRAPAEPGLGGVTVTLNRTGAAPRTTVTTIDGSFVFTSVAAGEVRIEQTVPDGFHATTPAALTLQLTATATAGVGFGLRSDDVRPPEITGEPADLLAAESAAGELRVAATGTEPLAYQWYKDGEAIAQATQPVLTFASLGTADAGAYQVRVRNPLGSTVSRTAHVSVTSHDPFASWAATQNLPAGLRNPQDDPDGDHLANLLEWLLGTPAGIATSSGLPGATLFTVDGSAHLGFEFNRSHAALAAHVFLEASADLVSWTEVPSTLSVKRTGGAVDVVRLLENAPVSSTGHHFLRLGVTYDTAHATPAKLTLLPAGPASTSFRLALEGQAGVTYLIERSDDLIHWTAVQPVTAGATAVTITDPTAAGVPARFYRAVAP